VRIRHEALAGRKDRDHRHAPENAMRGPVAHDPGVVLPVRGSRILGA
jgi:hypothetical protein